ncbi:MAG: tail protein X [Oscillospiraceae bacterium]|nr:tail protein X [Oscillospiraceae bacterium]
MSTYTTKQGDMWDTIALSQYDSLDAMSALMYANTQYIGTYIFPSGVVLNIPEIDEDNKILSSDLPPWVQESEEAEE